MAVNVGPFARRFPPVVPGVHLEKSAEEPGLPSEGPAYVFYIMEHLCSHANGSLTRPGPESFHHYMFWRRHLHVYRDPRSPYSRFLTVAVSRGDSNTLTLASANLIVSPIANRRIDPNLPGVGIDMRCIQKAAAVLVFTTA